MATFPATKVKRQPTSALAQQKSPVQHAGQWLRTWWRDPWAWLVGLGCLFVVVVSATHMVAPMTRDEGAFLIVGQKILQGGLPYRDAFDHKSPLIYYTLAVELFLTAPIKKITAEILFFRLSIVAANICTACGLIALGRTWRRMEIGFLAALVYLCAAPFYDGNYILTEQFMCAAAVWSVVVAARSSQLRGVLLSGLLMAFASLYKQTAVLEVPGLACVVAGRMLSDSLSSEWWPRLRQVLARLGILAAGLAAPWLLVLAYFALQGGASALIDQVVVANLVHYPPDPRAVWGPSTIATFELVPVIWVGAAAVLAVGVGRAAALFWRERRLPSLYMVGIFLLLGLSALPLEQHSFPHYWLQPMPWAAFLMATGAVALLNIWRGQSVTQSTTHATQPRSLLPAVLLPLVIALASSQWIDLNHVGQEYAQLHQQIIAGKIIARFRNPGARMLVLMAEPQYYFLSDYMPDTTYLYIQAINESPQLVDQVMTDIINQRYDIIVVGFPYPNFRQAVLAHYHAIYYLTTVDVVAIYQRNASP